MATGVYIKMHARDNRIVPDWTWLAYGWAALAATMGLFQTVADRLARPAYLFAEGGDDGGMTGEYTLLLSALVVAFGQILGAWTKYLRDRQAIRSEGAAGRVTVLEAENAVLTARVADRDREVASLTERIEARDHELEAIGEHNKLLIDRNHKLWQMLMERANLILGERDGLPTAKPALVVDKAVMVDTLAVIPKPDPLDDTPSPDEGK